MSAPNDRHTEAEAATETEDIVVDCDFDQSPETIWRALTTPDLLERWLAEGDIRPDVGHRFGLEAPAGPIDCEVLEAQPRRRLRLAWRERDGAGGVVESEVSFTLVPTITGGTRLRVTHGGFIQTGVTVMCLARIATAARPPRRPFQGALAWAA